MQQVGGANGAPEFEIDLVIADLHRIDPRRPGLRPPRPDRSAVRNGSLPEQPVQRDPIQAPIVVAAADVGVDAAEPHFDQLRVGHAFAAQTRVNGKNTRDSSSAIAWQMRVGGRRPSEVMAGVDLATGKAELTDDIEQTDEADREGRVLVRDLVRERQRQRRAAAESDDVNPGVARRLVVLQSIQRLADPAMAAQPPLLGEQITNRRLRARADAFQIERPERLLRIVVLLGS